MGKDMKGIKVEMDLDSYNKQMAMLRRLNRKVREMQKVIDELRGGQKVIIRTITDKHPKRNSYSFAKDVCRKFHEAKERMGNGKPTWIISDDIFIEDAVCEVAKEWIGKVVPDCVEEHVNFEDVRERVERKMEKDILAEVADKERKETEKRCKRWFFDHTKELKEQLEQKERNIKSLEDIVLEKEKKTNNMKARNIKVTLNKAREWYNSDNDSLKEVALQAFKEKELKVTFRDVKSFIDACNVLNIDKINAIDIVEQIKNTSRASAAIFEISII